jgi:hypothetical protein
MKQLHDSQFAKKENVQLVMAINPLAASYLTCEQLPEAVFPRNSSCSQTSQAEALASHWDKAYLSGG